MTTSQESSSTGLPEPQWHEAMAEFRARAERLFETRRDRMEFLEATIAEQLAAFGETSDRSPNVAAQNVSSSPKVSPGEIEDLHTQLVQCRKLLNARAGELKQLRTLIAQQADGVDGIDVEALLEQLSELRLERDELAAQLADVPRQAEPRGDVDSEHFADLQRRFEVAVREIRELKAKNADLRRQASHDAGTSHDATVSATTGFNWEQQKVRLLQQLESDFDDREPKTKTTKLSIEGTIRITDQVIAEKDRKIAELEALLHDASVGANESTSSELLNNDERIRAERERLIRLQDEWQDKLRQAEIDISVERAKLARERSEFEAKLRRMEETSSDKATGKAPARQSGRWLNRLGLKDDEK